VRVVTWNVQHARRPDTGEPDPLALAGACMRFDADVLALQEVDRGTARVRGADLLEIVADATGLTAVDGAALDFDGGTYGNALLVRDEPQLPVVVGLPRPWRAEPRALVSCELRGVVVACCHLGLGRGEAARQLGAVLQALHDAGPAILLGDLNLGPPSVSAVLSSAGGAWSQLEVAAAYPADEPAQAVDHVLVRAVKAATATVAERAPISDHRPVVADIDLG
jgi:endonuclease/exonuclease/phosphatase family metal-dependent hydrolase